MRFSLFLRVALMALLCAPHVAQAATAEEVRDWLDRMREAAQVQHYVGTFVYEHDGKLEAMRIVHQARPMMGEYEKLVSLIGEPREIHRNNDEVTCYLPKQRSVLVDKSRPRNPFSIMLADDVASVTAQYKLRHTRDYRVANRACREVEILPQDHYRYGYRLCLDQEKNLLLSAEVLGPNKDVIERMMYTSIEFPRQVPASWLAPELDSANYEWVRHERPAQAESVVSAAEHWDITQLPPGFRMSAMRPPSLPGIGKRAQHRVYSDGLASVSVFIETMNERDEPMQGGSKMGATNAYGRVVAGHQIMVVGDLPEAGVELIASSIRYRPHND